MSLKQIEIDKNDLNVYNTDGQMQSNENTRYVMNFCKSLPDVICKLLFLLEFDSMRLSNKNVIDTLYCYNQYHHTLISLIGTKILINTTEK